MILFQYPIEKIYRLLIVWSYTQNGIKPQEYKSIVFDICEHYGMNELNRIQKFEKEGLLRVKSHNKGENRGQNTFVYSNYATKFKLVNPNFQENDPDEKVHPYMSYTPLIARMTDLILTKEWKEPGLIHNIMK